MKKVFTLGTSRRSEEDFIEILKAYDILSLVDVRSFPRSRISIFSRELLEPFLAREGITYHFLGRELGGLRKGGYLPYIGTEQFMKGVGLIESIALRSPSVIICAEKFPWKCHRKWIARELRKRGWEVVHIIDKGKVWVPT
jgi:uncharacterized protein (DUF488 family)